MFAGWRWTSFVDADVDAGIAAPFEFAGVAGFGFVCGGVIGFVRVAGGFEAARGFCLSAGPTADFTAAS